MTRDKDRKRIIRNRMATTGESYTTARRQVIARATKMRPSLAAIAREPIDHAAIAGMSNDKIKQQTGHTWTDWVRLLDHHGAETMRHRDIARLVHEQYNVNGWWSQTVTVGYERLKGRRERGQRIDGAYEVSKSKTLDVPVDALFAAVADDRTRRRWMGRINATVRTSTAAKSMRLQWPDGTIVAFWFSSKGASKSVVSLAHSKLTTRSAMEQTKAEWSTRLDALARVLSQNGR
jgi:hypothetical protein